MTPTSVTASPAPAPGAPRAAHAPGQARKGASQGVDFAALLGIAVGFEAGELPADAPVAEAPAEAAQPLPVPDAAALEAEASTPPPATPESLFDPAAMNAAAVAPPATPSAPASLLEATVAPAPGPEPSLPVAAPIDPRAAKAQPATPSEHASPTALEATARDGTPPRLGVLEDPRPARDHPGDTPTPVPVPALKSGEPVVVTVPVQHALQGNLHAVPVAREAVAVPVGQPGFAEAAADRVAFIARQGIERAELQVTPPDLGPVSVKITIDNQVADVVMVAASAETRSALEQSLPDLASRLAESGLTLGQAHVGDGNGRAPAWAQDAPRFPGEPGGGTEGTGAPDDAKASAVRIVKVGLVDDFA